MSTAIDARRRPRFELQHRLALSREVAGLDQVAMAEALGVSRPTVSNYERGFTVPRRAILVAWALATAVDVDWLTNGETPPTGGGVPDKLPRLDSNQQPAGFKPVVSLTDRRVVSERVA